MTEDVSTIEPPTTTVIENDTETGASGAGTPRALPDTDAKPSLRDTISAVVKEEVPKEEAKADAEPKEATPKAEEKTEEAKPAAERGQDGKFVGKPKDGETAEPVEAKADAAEPEKPDAKHYPDPPKSFQADSRELYRNVPRAVRRDIDIMVRDHEAFREQATKATERYESIRPFDELALSNGRDLRESLQRINEVENAMQRDPIAGLNAILSEIGPRKADGSALNIYEIASHIIEQGPQQYQQRMQQFQEAQPAPVDPRLTDTQRQLAEAQEQLIAMQVIEPFKADHPRYDELHDTIVQILQSDMIKPSLSAPERLEAAYVMAERLVPPSARPAESEAPAPNPADRAADSLNGSKSIKSAPGSVSGDVEVARGGSITDILRDEAKRMRAR